MYRKIYPLLFTACFFFFNTRSFADVILTTSPIAAANIAQGATNSIVYTVKMDVTSLPVAVNSMQFTLAGTHDNNDLTIHNIYFNATAPTLTGATLIAANLSSLFAAPHAYNSAFNNIGSINMAAGTSGYFMIAVSTSTSATSGNTIKVDGAANPATFGYTTSPTITNSQTDIAGTQTILAAGINLSTSAIAAANIAQGATNSIVYAVKMDVTSLPVAVNSMQFTLAGTHDNNDLTIHNIYFNATAPTLTGATLLAANLSSLFAAPHAYNSAFNNFGSINMAAGTSGYFMIAVTTSTSATSGNTIKVDGAANPVTFGYTTSPTITNNQTDIAGTQTILAAGINLSTSAIAAANIAQGATNSIVYAVKMDVTSLPVAVNSMQFTLAGTHDNNDLTIHNIYFNATAPTLTGATLLAANLSSLFAAPHAYNSAFNNFGSINMAAGTSGYFMIAVSTSTSATSGNTIKVDGAANPVTFGYTTSPTITNNQTDIAGTQTILAAGINLTTSTIAAANIAQGATNSIVYAVKMDVTSLPVAVNSMQFTLAGTHDNNDLAIHNIYFNATAPTLTGATLLAANLSSLFAAPHAYNSAFNNFGSINIAAGTSGYFMITVSTSTSATSGNTIKVDGAANPVTFGYTTSPTITNNQTDIAGTQTILAAGINLSTSAIAAANIAQGATNSIVYAIKMDVTSLPVAVNSMQFTLAGTHDNDDLTTHNIYFNATAPTLTGATLLAANLSSLFAAPHAYNSAFNNFGSINMAAGTSGYFMITVSTSTSATSGNTIKVDGAANPATFGYTTSPTITNNQTDIAGTQTILAAGINLTTSAIAAANIAQGATNSIVYAVKMDVTSLPVVVNSMQFTLAGTHDNNDLTTHNIYFNAAAPTLTGATLLAANLSSLFAAPHAYNSAFNNFGSINMTAGASGYFMITVSVHAAATTGNTVKVDGAANPVIFGFTSSPTVANNQTDLAGTQTIGSALPLTLISFTGNLINANDVQLKWTTAMEQNTKEFEILWSDDGQQFSKIGVTPAAGNSSQNLQYSYIHKLPVNGNNYYRLKMVDKDGQFTFSPITKIKTAYTVGKIAVSPNPVINLLQLQVLSVKNETIVFHLHSIDGKMITSKSFTIIKGNNQLNWNLQQLASGNYFISSDNRQFETIKIIVD